MRRCFIVWINPFSIPPSDVPSFELNSTETKKHRDKGFPIHITDGRMFALWFRCCIDQSPGWTRTDLYPLWLLPDTIWMVVTRCRPRWVIGPLSVGRDRFYLRQFATTLYTVRKWMELLTADWGNSNGIKIAIVRDRFDQVPSLAALIFGESLVKNHLSLFFLKAHECLPSSHEESPLFKAGELYHFSVVALITYETSNNSSIEGQPSNSY